VMRDIPGMLSEPGPAVFVWSYDEFAIHYRVKYWIADYALQEDVRDSVVASLWYALRRHSIEIPFPVRSVEVRRPRAARKPEREYENAIIAELRQVDFLRALSHEELGMLVPRVRIHQFGSGEALVREGERGQSLYIIRDGVVGVTVQHSDGSQRHVANLTRPAIVGEMGMMTGEPRTATVKARTDVEVLEVGREAFGELFRKHPEAVNQISEIIAARMTEQREVRTAEAGADAGSARRNWLVAKMRQIFDI